MTAVVIVNSAKTLTRRTREEAKVVRSMNFPVPNFCLNHRFVRPNYAQRRRRFPCSGCPTRADISAKRPVGPPFRLTGWYANNFSTAFRSRTGPEIRLGGSSFQRVKEPLRHPPVFGADPADLCIAQY